MEKKALQIGGVPALLWGAASPRLFVAVHGDASHKEDTPIALLAEEAGAKGFQTLSFDLPQHGGRKECGPLCKAQTCVAELAAILAWARPRWKDISLFGCSIGAYFGMLACRDEPLQQALFLSPVVDMGRIIQNMMGWFGVSEQQLEQAGEIATPAKTLYWDYYQYVLAHPVVWDKPTALLYGRGDTLCEFDVIEAFVHRTGAALTVLEDGEHYFHTPDQLDFFRRWLGDTISS